MKTIKLLSIIAICSLLTSCATVISGSRQNVLIQSEPQGAEIYIKDRLVGKTPIALDIKRNTKTIVFKSETSYDYVHTCTVKSNPATWGNFLFFPYGTLPFLIVDIATGANKKQDPNIYVKMNLKPTTK